MSYPKYLIEQAIGRRLQEDEQIHHKDHNPLNNDLSNLEIRQLGEHQSEHQIKYFDTTAICQWCGKEFAWSAAQQRQFYANRDRSNRNHSLANPFCSRRCSGLYGKSREGSNPFARTIRFLSLVG